MASLSTGNVPPVPDQLAHALAARNRLVIRPRKIPPTQTEIDHLDTNVRLAAEAYRRLAGAVAGQGEARRMDHRGGQDRKPASGLPRRANG